MAFIGGAIGIITPNISDSISEMLVSMSAWAEMMAKLGNREGFIGSFYLYIRAYGWDACLWNYNCTQA